MSEKNYRRRLMGVGHTIIRYPGGTVDFEAQCVDIMCDEKSSLLVFHSLRRDPFDSQSPIQPCIVGRHSSEWELCVVDPMLQEETDGSWSLVHADFEATVYPGLESVIWTDDAYGVELRTATLDELRMQLETCYQALSVHKKLLRQSEALVGNDNEAHRMMIDAVVSQVHTIKAKIQAEMENHCD